MPHTQMCMELVDYMGRISHEHSQNCGQLIAILQKGNSKYIGGSQYHQNKEINCVDTFEF